jgi:hypothetical protein
LLLNSNPVYLKRQALLFEESSTSPERGGRSIVE